MENPSNKIILPRLLLRLHSLRLCLFFCPWRIERVFVCLCFLSLCGFLKGFVLVFVRLMLIVNS